MHFAIFFFSSIASFARHQSYLYIFSIVYSPASPGSIVVVHHKQRMSYDLALTRSFVDHITRITPFTEEAFHWLTEEMNLQTVEGGCVPMYDEDIPSIQKHAEKAHLCVKDMR